MLTVTSDMGKDLELKTLVKEAKRLGVGVGMVGLH